ncbi:MAG: hypothetical protein B6D39_10690 [Anaerolineae bacterium UTCFX2]|jgi:LAO/AO transport system kinase|nr:methylmalonyl Co-A mutase-associated GTPase MeaB [Anaerolineales bacterium]OQY88746.1 MAG: hypothetical protein B6D39_10690 [Anaerolineae bacterium UTCFX2]
MTLSQELLAGSRLALARVITQIENGTEAGRIALDELFPYTGRAHLIGVTGAPGTGKSSLVNQLAIAFRQSEDGEAGRVGIVAVDPSSPFSGGAILGDRVRMRDLAGDSGVFIRSMASRGSVGGLAVATSGVVQALDAAGFEIILIETVGAGQAEVDIARLAHTTLVVEAPGLGDDIQALKAGILEIADILVINKADRPGVESTERALLSMLQLAYPAKQILRDHSSKPGHRWIEAESPPSNPANSSEAELWVTPVVKTIAVEGQGVSELRSTIELHRRFLAMTGEREQRERRRLHAEVDLLLRDTLLKRWMAGISDGQYEQILDLLVRRELSPWRAVQLLIEN